MPIDDKDLVPVIDEMLGFVSESLTTQARQQEQIEHLSSKAAQHERVILEKVAEVKSQVGLNAQELDLTLNYLVGQHLIAPGDLEKIASEIRKNPNKIFSLLTKVAETLDTSAEGHGIPSEDVDEQGKSDPDGWNEAAKGKVPRIKP